MKKVKKGKEMSFCLTYILFVPHSVSSFSYLHLSLFLPFFSKRWQHNSTQRPGLRDLNILASCYLPVSPSKHLITSDSQHLTISLLYVTISESQHLNTSPSHYL